MMETQGTGIKADIGTSRSRKPLPVPRPGEHMWVVVAAWRVTDPASPRFELDTENLLSVDGPGCFVCEEQYTPRIAYRRCKGEPRA